MSITGNFDQSIIEGKLAEIIRKSGISERVFQGHRPSATEEKMNDFVVVKVTGKIYDRLAYGDTVCSVDLFARDIRGLKNSKRLSEMYKKLNAVLPVTDEFLMLGQATPIADTSDGFGFTVRMINIKTIIKI